MILYFDSYIIDSSLGKRNPTAEKEDIRSKSPAYNLPKKIDITKYSLASYAVYPWSHVLIRYELAEPERQTELDQFILNIFPKAQIIHQRSDSQADYLESLKILESFDDPWIFYTPNNDHPLIVSKQEDINYIDRLIKKAGAWVNKNEFVSIPYSHFSEYVTAPYKTSANYKYFGIGTPKLLEEDAESITVRIEKGDYNSLQIVHKNLFRDWFTYKDFGDKRIIRAEDVGVDRNKSQIEIIPKKQLAFHFDAYEHMLGYVNEIWNDLIPPYIIPKGFFENNIRIAYGFDDYKPEYTNINPAAKNYSFRDLKHGTDLKIGLDDIPLFWKSRIKEMLVNPNLDKEKMTKAILHQQNILKNPWAVSSMGLNFKTLRFYLKLWVFPYRSILQKLRLIPILKKMFGYKV